MDRTSDRPALGEQLRQARERAGLTVTSASEEAGIDATVLADLEADRRRPTPADLDRLSSALGADLTGLLPPRRPVEFHPSTGNLVIDGVRQRRVGTGSVEDVQQAYLSLLYAVRGGRRGQELPLRASDVEALLAVVGDDPDRLAQRLVELMHCTPEEAVLLRRVLLRYRTLTAAVGAAAGLSLVALAGVGPLGDALSSADASVVQDEPTPRPSPSVSELSGGTSSLSTDPRSDEEAAEIAELLGPQGLEPVGPADELPDPSPSPTPDVQPSPDEDAPISGVLEAP